MVITNLITSKVLFLFKKNFMFLKQNMSATFFQERNIKVYF